MANDTAVLEGKAYATWFELREPKMDLLKGDVTQAIEWFNDEVSVMPKLVLLNPKCQQFADEVPEGINTEISGMPLAHEVMMATVEKVMVENRAFSAIIIQRTPEPEMPQKILTIEPLKKSAKKPAEKPIHKKIPVRGAKKPKLKQVASHKTLRGGRRGRPTNGFPIEKIMAMFGSGMKAPAVLKQLEAEGINISRRSLFYIKAGQRQLI